MNPDAANADAPHDDVITVESPPTTLGGIVRRLGPGLIIAGSIVGSGELIATTKTGAVAGISLLWLILVGCVIKVFVQIELGRYTVASGQTTLQALDIVPGPRLRVGWLVWLWLVMILGTLGQLGGIIGGVGQAVALALPITGDYRHAIGLPSEAEFKSYLGAGEASNAALTAEEQRRRQLGRERFEERLARHEASLAKRIAAAGQLPKGQRTEALEKLETLRPDKVMQAVRALMASEAQLAAAEESGDAAAIATAQETVKTNQTRVDAMLKPITWDDRVWAFAVALFTILLLFRGRYGIVQNVSTVLVVLFTFITIGNVIALEMKPEFRLTAADFLRGFSLPQDQRGLFVALATFGIIGVGASELVSYPYWCLEKGYARFTGPRSDDAGWARRARGWMKVMHYDAFTSMVVYTIATMAFFLMGVAVLYRQGLDPEGMRMVSTLAEQYVPVFGAYAHWLFLLGAVAVLYSTFMVATAGHSRMFTDCFKVYGLMSRDSLVAHRRSVSAVCVIVPLVAVGIYSSGANPVTLVLVGATFQALMLPLLAAAALYFRYAKTDPRIKPGRLWDALLVLSSIGMLIAGGWLAYDKGPALIQQLLGLFGG